MLKTLLKARFGAITASMFRTMDRRGKKSRGTKILFALLFVYLAVVLTLSMGMVLWSIGQSLVAANLGWLFLAVSGLMAVSFCFIGTVFLAQSQIYQARDNELLLSLPVKPSVIVASRLLAMLGLNYIYTAVIMLPAGVIYAKLAQPEWSFYLVFALGFLLLPLLSLTLTCILGYVLGVVTNRMRYKTLLSSIGMVLFFLVYMYLYMNLTRYAAQLIQNGAAIGAAVRRALPPFYAFGEAAATGNAWAAAQLVLWCVVPFALVAWLLMRSFRRIATSKRGAARIVYKARALRTSSAYGALVRKELGRFFGTPAYAFNSGFGGVLLLVLAGYTAFKGPGLIATLGAAYGVGEMGGMLVPVLAVMVAFLCAMTCTTAPSISLEGPYLWILKANPVPVWTVFWAKITLNLIIGLAPALVALPVLAVSLKLTLLQLALLFAVATVFTLLASFLGLSANLLFPRLDWLSETAVIKQSVSAIIAVFGGMAAVMAPTLLYAFALSDKIGFMPYAALVLGVYALVCAALAWFLHGKGRRLFAAL